MRYVWHLTWNRASITSAGIQISVRGRLLLQASASQSQGDSYNAGSQDSYANDQANNNNSTAANNTTAVADENDDLPFTRYKSIRRSRTEYQLCRLFRYLPVMRICAVLFLLWCSVQLNAQDMVRVSGNVYNENGLPASNVMVINQSLGTGVFSRGDGSLSINLERKDTLLIAATGYGSRRVLLPRFIGQEQL